jgi:hypothetical protein
MKSYRELIESVKPKKGDTLLTIYGDTFKISGVNRGVIYATEPDKMEQYVIPVADAISIGRGQWKETMGGA